MNFDEALQFMEGRIRFGWKLDLERFTALCERLGNPQHRYAVLHVAGTKGKGSTTALAAAILHEQGGSVGSYFSPYVYDVRERVQHNGTPISKEDFARLVTHIRPHIKALEQTELGATTEFELKTAVAFCYFAEKQVDFACVEVGIGGRLDATNVVQPDVTLITNIGLDHTAILGDTYAKIAAEKAGILKQGIPCFTATANFEALDVIETIAKERDVPLCRVGKYEASQQNAGTYCTTWASDSELGAVQIHTPNRRYKNLAMRMGGWYQRENAACAVAAVENMLQRRGVELAESAVRRALANTALPGRLTAFRLPHGPLVILDGAHNGLAAEALAAPISEIRSVENIRRLLLVVGMLGGHDPADFLRHLAPQAAKLYACQPTWRRALPAEEIELAAAPFVAERETVRSVEFAVRTALAEARPDDLLLVTGSFYTVGEAAPDKIQTWFQERGPQES